MVSKPVAIKKCRVCGSKKIIDIISLGNQYLTNFVDSEKEKWPKGPLDIVLCDRKSGGCGLLQLKHTTPLDLLYKKYWYVSGINQTMKDALSDIAQKTEKIAKLKKGDIVIDIGSNDSTLLRSYRIKGLLTIGFEPAGNLMEMAKLGVSKIFNNFFNYKDFKKKYGRKKAKAITAIAMFYDLDDPNSFIEDIVNCLDKNGLFIIQMNYLPLMIKNMAFDNISHEHLEYYSLKTLEYLLNKHGLEVFDAEINNVNGGSIRTYIKFKGSRLTASESGADKRLRKIKDHEKNMGLETINIYKEFAKRINEIKIKTIRFIKKEKTKGKSIYIYGASTRGNVLLQAFGLSKKEIKAAADRNPMKWGKKMIGSWIPIISEEQARKEKPDYFFVLPWQFLEEFLKRENYFLNSGGKFIVSCPNFKIIGKK